MANAHTSDRPFMPNFAIVTSVKLIMFTVDTFISHADIIQDKGLDRINISMNL